MFDPKTLVYSNKFFNIWHKDPCKDGSDDSCDWFGHKKKLSPQLEQLGNSIWHLETILDNRPFYPDHSAHLRFQKVKEEFRKLRIRSKWRIHPKFHIWHWRVQIFFIQNFKRWAFTRCHKCNGKFKWGQSGIGSWDGEGPQWFKSEYLCHSNCYRHEIKESTEGEK